MLIAILAININMTKKILLSIPAKNEGKTISGVIKESLRNIKLIDGLEPSILVVDDGSTDDTKNEAEEAGAKVFRSEKSIGLGNVFQKAVNYAVEEKFDYMLTIDGDGQFNEKNIPLLLRPVMNDEADLVTGSRFELGSKLSGIPEAKRFGNHLMSYLISSILDKKFNDVSCGFRAYNRDALLNLNLKGGFTYTQETFLNLGYKNLRIKEVPIDVKYFQNRKSRIAGSLFKYGWQTLKIILASLSHYKPFKLFGTLAGLFAFVGLPITTILTVRYFDTGMITPYKALGSIGLLSIVISGLLIIIGMILDRMAKIQMDLDKILYYEKRRK